MDLRRKGIEIMVLGFKILYLFQPFFRCILQSLAISLYLFFNVTFHFPRLQIALDRVTR